MKILFILFLLGLIIEFCRSFYLWAKSETHKEFGWRFADTLLSLGMIAVFIKIMELLLGA